MLGLQELGPVVNVEKTSFPFRKSRRLVTDADVKGDANRAHGAVVPGGNAPKDGKGNYLHEEVWRYLFTHTVDETGKPVPADPDCRMDQRGR